MATAFQPNAFQRNAFQIDADVRRGGGDIVAWWQDPNRSRRARRAVEERDRKERELEKAIEATITRVFDGEPEAKPFVVKAAMQAAALPIPRPVELPPDVLEVLDIIRLIEDI